MTAIWSRISASFKASFGDIVFGMEDGTVSIFGLVFGVAASTSDSRIVLSTACTAVVLIILGIGRARIGGRRLSPTTLQTLGIAAAGAAGVLVGSFFS